MEKKIITNIYLGAAFMCWNAKLIGVDRSDPNHVAYEFEGENLVDIKAEWLSGELIGNLSEYASHLKNLKQELYAHD